MIEAKFTKGPWFLNYGGIPTPYIEICEIETRCGIVGVAAMGTSGDPAANARLIAAAPELLEALQNVSGFIDTPIMRRKLGIDQQNPPEWLKSVRAAIAKAKGESDV